MPPGQTTQGRRPNINGLATPVVVNSLKFAGSDAAVTQFVYPPLL